MLAAKQANQLQISLNCSCRSAPAAGTTEILFIAVWFCSHRAVVLSGRVFAAICWFVVIAHAV
jgi:hypothetical protein